MFQLILAMVIWGTLGLAVLKSGLGSFDIAFYRCLVGALFLMPYCWYKGYFNNPALTLRTISLILLGGVFVIFNWVLLFQSFKIASITLGNVSYYAQPVFLVILGRYFFKENVSTVKWILILLTMCGVCMTMDLTVNDFQINNAQLLGVFCALSAGLLYSFATVIAKNVKNVPPTMMTLLQLFVGIVVLLPFTHFSVTQITLPMTFYILVFGLIYTVAAFTLYYHSVKKLSTTTIAVVSYIDPIVAIISDVLFFDRTLGAVQVFGILLTLVSSYLVVNPEVLRINGISAAFRKLFKMNAQTRTGSTTSIS